MGRHARVSSLIEWSNGFWYYRLPGMKGYKSTGTRDHHDAVLFTQEKMKSAELPGPRRAPLLKEYSADFFVWDRCPHCRKLREEGGQITKRYAHGQRLLLKKYLLTDRIADKQLSAITRADVLDYRSRLAALLGSKVNTANKALAVLKTILKEALFREDLTRDPTVGVGNLKEQRKEAGIFTTAELLALFPLEGLGPWADLQTKTCFLVAATTGMRRGEILALRWKHIDFEARLVRIDEAWKSRDETGTPKWGHKRVVSLPDVTAVALRDLWERRDPALADRTAWCSVTSTARGSGRPGGRRPSPRR